VTTGKVIPVIGQTVVYNSMVSVVTDPILAGQSVTVGAHDVMVYTVMVLTVDVVSRGLVVETVVGAGDAGPIVDTGLLELEDAKLTLPLDVETELWLVPDEEID
jgi:hypothetical protein